METKSPQFTCKLTAPELQKRKATVIAELKCLRLDREERPDGFSYSFQAEDAILDKLNEFIKTERRCCDFLEFQVTIKDNRAVLLITGPDGAKEFMKHEIGL